MRKKTVINHDMGLFLKALHFAADKHRDQRRKDKEASPYINHPIQVADLLKQVGGVDDIITLIGALLHDTLEDTATTPDELRHLFGEDILSVVQEVTDDKTLSKVQRKRLQIEHAPHKSTRAKLIKLADKICNVRDVHHSPPHNWSFQRRSEYLTWTEKVVAGLRGVNPALEALYDHTIASAHYDLAHEQAQIPQFNVGDRVRHPKRPEWGIGKIIECTFDQRLRVFFVSVGIKRLKLENSSLLKLTSEAGAHPLLDHLRPITTGEKVRYRGVSELTEILLSHFEEGFYADDYIAQHRFPELQAHPYLQGVLNHIVFTQLLQTEAYAEISIRALEVLSRTRLLKSEVYQHLAQALTDPKNQVLFAKSLYELLFGRDTEEHLFEQFAACLAQFNALNWQLATYFLFMSAPHTAMLCNPRVVSTAADWCLFELHYDKKPNWHTYQQLLAFSQYLKQELADMQPRDMLDIYIFLALVTNHLSNTPAA